MEEALFRVETVVEEVASAHALKPGHVRGAVDLLAEGNTIPFVARYRKERTGGLDEAALRAVEDALHHHRELAERKSTILKTIADQGKLDAGLRQKILSCGDRKQLEDIYLPYKPKRRTRATMARERGLEPLAEILRAQRPSAENRDEILAPFVDPENDVPDAAAALRGACDIVAESWAEAVEIRHAAREVTRQGVIVTRVKRDWKGKTSKFEMYYDYREPLRKIPSHRFLAIRRGENEGVLQAAIEVDEEGLHRRLKSRLLENASFTFHAELEETVEDCCARLLLPSVESSELAELKEASEDEAIAVFAQNLGELLLAPPAGPRVVLGVDPGFRTGCKIAVVDATGKFLENATMYPTAPRRDVAGASKLLLALIQRHGVELVAIGNGTASRETHAFVTDLLRREETSAAAITVSEAGASVYSASDIARKEFPELDLTVRGAISIARRLQDPLAELVKIDPKAIGVGQYQHDVNQTKLKKALDREVASSVNRVGVDLNTASAALLAYVAGIGPRLAASIVRHRDDNGPFKSRRALLDVPRLGSKAVEQAAGFLRIRDGDQPLDNSAVHPESYPVVEKMAQAAGVETSDLIGSPATLGTLRPEDFVDDTTGLPTVRDIIQELEKPGRDPRKQFQVPRFSEGVNEVSDLEVGMTLEAVITNVTRFGAFADVGVHQDGLIHISELDRKFVKDPGEVVAVGDIVKVKVLQVDTERGRIALSRKQLL